MNGKEKKANSSPVVVVEMTTLFCSSKPPQKKEHDAGFDNYDEIYFFKMRRILKTESATL